MGSIGPREEGHYGLSTAPDNDSLRKIVDVQKVPPMLGTETLYEALGFAHEINVIVPYYGRRQIVRGPVYSYYEFRSNDQWNSEKWKKLESYKLPQWIDNYYEVRRLDAAPQEKRCAQKISYRIETFRRLQAYNR